MQDHPMSAVTGIERKEFITNHFSAEERLDHIPELYFEDWPVKLSFKITGSFANNYRTNDQNFRTEALSLLNGDIFFEENNISINHKLDTKSGIPNVHDPEIMNQLYQFGNEQFSHSTTITKFYFANANSIMTATTERPNELGKVSHGYKVELGNYDSGIIIDQSDSSNHRRPFNLFLQDGTYPRGTTHALLPEPPHSFKSRDFRYYVGGFNVQYEIDGSIVSRSSYHATVLAGSYTSAQIKLDVRFHGDLILWVATKTFNAAYKVNITQKDIARGLNPDIPLTPYNDYNRRNHVYGSAGWISEPSNQLDSVTFRGLKR
tara:strand:+ start:40 stop:996 length:957 start_codon:yes stop_codon:yes gene_type:complete